jgi:hypothetical protein
MTRITTRDKRVSDYFINLLILAIFVCGVMLPAQALAVSLNVIGVDKDGTQTAIPEYRWLLEQDDTYHVQFDASGNPVPDANTLSVNFHKSYMPVAAKGDQTDAATISLPLPNTHYYVSVIPKAAGQYSIGGAAITPEDSAGTVTVYLNQLPLPTAQITIFVFEDNAPINNAPDLPVEQGLGGFTILLEDAGGRYGASAGAQMADVYGNPLGTQYVQTCDEFGQNPGSGSFGCLDPDGAAIPVVDRAGMIVVEPLVSGPDGYVTIKNLAPGKYGIQAVPPDGAGYQQTTTIEGTKVIDAWVKANEPPFFAEFGPAGVHVFIGFIQPFIDSTVLNGGQTITGQVTNLHLSRPPDTAFYSGAPFEHTTPWVGLNDNAGLAGASNALYAGRVNGDGTFSIHNVPAGNYQLAVWDDNMDIVFAFHGITVTDTGCTTSNLTCNLGDVPVFQWFSRLENWVYNDINGNGIRETGEAGILEQGVLLRWRDGTVNQAMPTDGDGYVPFDQVFPFFSWQVAEIDFARFKATGVTVTVDDGGALPAAPDGEVLRGQTTPQEQNMPIDLDSTFPNGFLSRTETGPVLTQAYQGFLGQTSIMEWGKAAYGPNENGGISGIVFYSTVRGEDDPKLGGAEVWEPGIPRVTVNLLDATGAVLATTATDSWDDSVPANCQYGSSEQFIFTAPDGTINATDCFDGMRNWNQVRPGVFDGGYAFGPEYSIADDFAGAAPAWITVADPLNAPDVGYITPGEYTVEVIPPTGYEIVKSEDRNVDFGDNYVPSPNLLPSECVGTLYTVGPELTLFPGTPAPLAGTDLNLCDRKQVALSSGQNAAADFFLFTEVPISSHIFGIILDDTANEFDPNSPQKGEKYAPPWMPIGIYDWTGQLIGQTYSDQFGRFNALVPSTSTANLPQPSGMSPNMLTTCMNDSNPLADPMGRHNPQYSSFCYNFNYMPGTTTYLDTPVVPVAAFAGPDQAPLDCELDDGVPRIYSVTNYANEGPFVNAPGETIIINAMGNAVPVPNPEYDGTTATAATIPRDYSFGTTPGTVSIGGVPLTGVTWTGATIVGTVAAGTETGQLIVSRGDNGQSSVVGVTVHVGLTGAGNNVQAIHTVQAGQSIQAVIDAPTTRSNDIILVAPGTYAEMLIMWKPVRLQGWGAGSTTINAVKNQTNKLQDWRLKVEELVTNGSVTLLPGQETAFGGIEPGTLFTEEGAGVLVLPRASGSNSFGQSRNHNARIDGFTIIGADTGGGIVVNGYADYLQITNNRITNNSGFYGGGIRLGHPTLADDAQNDNITISHNHISRNGGLNGAGGGVSLHNGADSYAVADNDICGNFTMGHGGGIGHYGLSEISSTGSTPTIRDNTISFNQSFNQGLSVSGGGIFVGGQSVLTGLSPGSGSVVIDSNLIQGNQAGAGDGGGISLAQINGDDVASNPRMNNNNPWHRIDMLNNMIVNNMSALAGGGIAMQDAVLVSMVFNSVANNDSTATAAGAFTPGQPNWTNPQPAGIVSRAHSAGLIGAFTNRTPAEFAVPFANPQMVDNIIWHNRSFNFFGDPGATPPVYALQPVVSAADPGLFWDFAVLGTATDQFLNPTYSILTTLADSRISADANGNLVQTSTGHIYDATTNLTTDPSFAFEYYNGGRGTTVKPGETTTAIAVPAAFDEGGNFIQARFGPLTKGDSDYHIQPGSPSVDNGSVYTGFVPGETTDFDGEPRPSGNYPDIGADEVVQ